MATLITLANGASLRVSDLDEGGTRTSISAEALMALVEGGTDPWIRVFNDDAGEDSPSVLVNLRQVATLDPDA